MKYMLGFTGSFLILCLLITAIILPNMPDAQASEQNQQQSEIILQSSAAEEKSEKEEYEYILCGYKGVIAAYKTGQSDPVYISTVRVSDLPENDRKRLENGIGAVSRRELTRLIEEYCS